ncbi:GTP pyrophosphokinase [uncultured Desulfobacter sp.]|uniref:GTP pyrophosphokinase n=1 Tax=uncultured Desulfobacter sp. TaxID=240139 RepID=UPI002AAB95CA|nr:GTP pyrophosphokinase [uncultured Desulfobacter sp.]
MRKKQRDDLLISFFKQKEKYKKLAEYVVRLLSDDPSAPKESIHTILYRIKDASRLIEKIDQENLSPESDLAPITHKNFKERIGDIIGIRIVCLRLSDIVNVEAYLEYLVEEKILTFLQQPDYKRTFVLPIDPGKAVPKDISLQYSGYSSIHYQVKLGENSDVGQAFKSIQIELQLRTILEEAWGEIDHKYRYRYSRIGDTLPGHIHTGFYNLSAYLQAAAMQAEQLCRDVEAYSLTRPLKSKGNIKISIPPESEEKETINGLDDPLQVPPALKSVLEETFGFKTTTRTLAYIMRRLKKLGFSQRSKSFFQKIFKKRRLNEFRSIYQEVLNQDPFKDGTNRNIDLINAVNFALFDEIEGAMVAKEGLRSTLKWRKDRLSI